MGAISEDNMNIESFISGKKHSEAPSAPKEKVAAAEKGVEWIGREKVLKTFRKFRPENDNADVYLKAVGL